MSISKKPWNSRDFGNSRAAFAQHFLDSFPPDSPEFQEILPNIAADLCLPIDTPAEDLHERLTSFKALFTEHDEPSPHFSFSELSLNESNAPAQKIPKVLLSTNVVDGCC